MAQHYLCISVTFLDRYYHGREINDLQAWPPSPLRLFCAMINGAHLGAYAETWPEVSDGLRWLETLPPPLIIAPKSIATKPYRSFAPTNDADALFDPQERLVSKVFQPYYLSDGQTVHYLFPIDPSQSDVARRVAQSARRIVALGRGIDVAIGHGQIITDSDTAVLSGERWLPSPDGKYLLRAPTHGTLQEAIEVHDRKMSIALSLDNAAQNIWLGKLWITGHPVRYRRIVPPPLRPVAVFAVRPLPNHHYLQHYDIARLAAMMRHVLIQIGRAKSKEFYIPGGVKKFIAGHLSDEDHSFRLSYLPLPVISDHSARGQLRFAAVAAPYDCRDEYVRWIWESLPGTALVEIRTRSPIAQLLPIDHTDEAIAPYIQPARTWASVTPVLLPGYDDGREQKANKLLYRSLQRAGVDLDLVASVEIAKKPFVDYLPKATYFRPAHLSANPAWHVRITFNQAIPGPLNIGAGRHVGLGLFAHAPGDG